MSKHGDWKPLEEYEEDILKNVPIAKKPFEKDSYLIPSWKGELTLKDYAAFCETTDVHGKEPDVTYCMVALAGEVGELCNKWKKVLRGDPDWAHLCSDQSQSQTPVCEKKKAELLDELGDVLWYVARIAEAHGGLEAAVRKNVLKLTRRHLAGTIKGSGDDR